MKAYKRCATYHGSECEKEPRRTPENVTVMFSLRENIRDQET